jgi:hypothetical protein
MPATAAHGVELVPFNESRWPPAAAVFVFMILNIAVRIWLPRDALIAVPWLLPALEAAIPADRLGFQSHFIRDD